MANTIKLNKVTKFNAIKKALVDAGVEVITVDGIDFSATEFCDREIEIISNKKSTKKRVDNSGYFEKVTDALSNGAKTPTELMSLIGVENTQKVAAILKGMGDMVQKSTKGKKVFYSLAE